MHSAFRRRHRAPDFPLPQLEALLERGDHAVLAHPRDAQPVLYEAIAIATGCATGQTLQGLADGRECLGIGRTRLANRVADTGQIIRIHGATSASAPDDRAARRRIRRSRPSLATYIVLQMNLHIDRQLQIFVIDEIAMRE
jgi:hypothetical protein